MMPKKDEYDLKRELWVYQRLYSKTNWDDLMKTKGINIPTLMYGDNLLKFQYLIVRVIVELIRKLFIQTELVSGETTLKTT